MAPSMSRIISPYSSLIGTGRVWIGSYPPLCTVAVTLLLPSRLSSIQGINFAPGQRRGSAARLQGALRVSNCHVPHRTLITTSKTGLLGADRDLDGASEVAIDARLSTSQIDVGTPLGDVPGNLLPTGAF